MPKEKSKKLGSARSLVPSSPVKRKSEKKKSRTIPTVHAGELFIELPGKLKRKCYAVATQDAFFRWYKDKKHFESDLSADADTARGCADLSLCDAKVLNDISSTKRGFAFCLEGKSERAFPTGVVISAEVAEQLLQQDQQPRVVFRTAARLDRKTWMENIEDIRDPQGASARHTIVPSVEGSTASKLTLSKKKRTPPTDAVGGASSVPSSPGSSRVMSSPFSSPASQSKRASKSSSDAVKNKPIESRRRRVSRGPSAIPDTENDHLFGTFFAEIAETEMIANRLLAAGKPADGVSLEKESEPVLSERRILLLQAAEQLISALEKIDGETHVSRSDLVPIIDRLTAAFLQAREDAELIDSRLTALMPEALRQRKHIMNEILATERSYVQCLSTLEDVFYRPILDRFCDLPPKQKSEEIPRSIVASIFGNIDSIQGIHTRFLNALETKINLHAFQTVNFGDEFDTILSEMKPVYSLYVQNYEKGQANLKALLQAPNPKFAEFVKTAHKNPMCNLLGIDDFLIMPVQRLPRFEMLFGDLLKHAQGDEARHVSRLLAGIREVTEFINSSKRASDSKARLEKLDNNRLKVDRSKSKLLPDGNLASRDLLREGFLPFARVGKPPKKFYVFVFTDMVLISQQQPMKQKLGGQVLQTMRYDFQTSVPLDSSSTVLISEVEREGMFGRQFAPSSVDLALCFQLVPKKVFEKASTKLLDKSERKNVSNTVYTWVCENSQSKASWVATFMRALNGDELSAVNGDSKGYPEQKVRRADATLHDEPADSEDDYCSLPIVGSVSGASEHNLAMDMRVSQAPSQVGGFSSDDDLHWGPSARSRVKLIPVSLGASQRAVPTDDDDYGSLPTAEELLRGVRNPSVRLHRARETDYGSLPSPSLNRRPLVGAAHSQENDYGSLPAPSLERNPLIGAAHARENDYGSLPSTPRESTLPSRPSVSLNARSIPKPTNQVNRQTSRSMLVSSEPLSKHGSYGSLPFADSLEDDYGSLPSFDSSGHSALAPPTLPVCAKCGISIPGSGVSVLGLQLHQQCFNCSSCSTNLVVSGGVKQNAGKLYCSPCHDRQFTQRCERCGGRIRSAFVTIPLPSGGCFNIHNECLTCESCHGPVLGSYSLEGDKIKCATCSKR